MSFASTSPPIAVKCSATAEVKLWLLAVYAFASTCLILTHTYLFILALPILLWSLRNNWRKYIAFTHPKAIQEFWVFPDATKLRFRLAKGSTLITNNVTALINIPGFMAIKIYLPGGRTHSVFISAKTTPEHVFRALKLAFWQ